MYLDKYKNEINSLCLQNKVKSLYVFGSVLTDRFNEKSDIDLVVDIDSNDPFDYADSYFNLKFALQDLFRRPIDLLENKAKLAKWPHRFGCDSFLISCQRSTFGLVLCFCSYICIVVPFVTDESHTIGFRFL